MAATCSRTSSPGHYTLSAARKGLPSLPRLAMELVARQSARVDLAFSLAQVQQTVNVEATAEQINTENATVGDTRGTDQLVEMPLNFRAQTTSPLAALAFLRASSRIARATSKSGAPLIP